MIECRLCEHEWDCRKDRKRIANYLNNGFISTAKERVDISNANFQLDEYGGAYCAGFFSKSCDNCRHDRDLPSGQKYDFGGCGGDCSNCRDLSDWMPFKRYDPELCAKCEYEEDPCNSDCVECQDGKNFLTPHTRKEELQAELRQKQLEISKLEAELKMLN